jgi:hypothetical protein
MTEVNLTSRITLPKRAMTLGVATETRTVKGFYPKHWYGDAHHNDAQEGHDTHMHRRCWRWSTKFLPEITTTPYRGTMIIPRNKSSLQVTLWEPPLPKHHRLHDPPSSALRRPHNQRNGPPLTQCYSPKSQRCRHPLGATASVSISQWRG